MFKEKSFPKDLLILLEEPKSTRLTEVILQPLCEQSRAEPQVTRGKSPRETGKGDEPSGAGVRAGPSAGQRCERGYMQFLEYIGTQVLALYVNLESANVFKISM